MHYAGANVALVILSVWLLGGICMPFTGPRGSGKRRIIRVLAGALTALGVLSFFGHAIADSGGFKWLPNSFEWPVGIASGVATMPDGGCRLIVSTARGARRGGPDVTSTETLARRITGWFAAVVWCTAGVMWNVGIFAVLIRAASKGEGWTILILLLWSLIGLFLLGILFIAIGSVIDGIWRLVRKKPSHARPMR